MEVPVAGPAKQKSAGLYIKQALQAPTKAWIEKQEEEVRALGMLAGGWRGVFDITGTTATERAGVAWGVVSCACKCRVVVMSV
jgi:hypothetical protein